MLDLKKLYPDALFDPNPNCKFCGGVGQRIKKINSTCKKIYACACLYVDHALCNEVNIDVSTIVKKIKLK